MTDKKWTILAVIAGIVCVIILIAQFIPDDEPTGVYTVHQIKAESPAIEYEAGTIESAVKNYVSHRTTDKNNLEVTALLHVVESSKALTKDFADRDATRIIEKLRDNDLIGDHNGVAIVFQAELADAYGNAETDDAVVIYVEKDAIDRINFDNFEPEHLADIAENYWLHAALQ